MMQLRQADKGPLTLELASNAEVFAVYRQRMAILATQLHEDRVVSKQAQPHIEFWGDFN